MDWWSAWWAALATPDKVFWAIALLTSAILGIQILLLLLGFDGDADVDFGGAGDLGDLDAAGAGDLDHGDGFGILSVRTVTAFFTGFGWGGVLALDAGLSLAPALAVATVSGGALMGAVYGLMQALYSLRYSGTLDYRNAVGARASVYLPIPAQMAGTGQVTVPLQGRLMTVKAMTRSAERLPNRLPVKVVGLVDSSTLLVEPLGEPSRSPSPSSEAPAEGSGS